MKGLKCQHIKKMLLSLFVLVASLVLSFSSFFTYSAFAAPTSLIPSQFAVYGEPKYATSNAWSSLASVGSPISFYRVYQVQLVVGYYSGSGKHLTIEFDMHLTGSPISFQHTRPLVFGNCLLGGELITLTSQNVNYRVGTREGQTTSSSDAYLFGRVEGYTDNNTSGSLVCTMTGVGGEYIAYPLQNGVNYNFSVASAAFSVDSFSSDEARTDQTQLDQLRQLTDVNTNLVIVNQAVNNMSIQVKGAISSASSLAHQDSQAQLDESKKQTQVMEETKDFVTDTNTPSSDDIVNDSSMPSVGLLPAGPLDSILTLPLNIANSILSSLGGSCTPIVAPLPYVNQNLTFPCLGETIYQGDFAGLEALIGAPATAVILFYYFKHLYKKVNRAVTLETTVDDEWGVL